MPLVLLPDQLSLEEDPQDSLCSNASELSLLREEVLLHHMATRRSPVDMDMDANTQPASSEEPMEDMSPRDNHRPSDTASSHSMSPTERRAATQSSNPTTSSTRSALTETADMVSADTEDAPTVDAHMEDARDHTDTER